MWPMINGEGLVALPPYLVPSCLSVYVECVHDLALQP